MILTGAAIYEAVLGREIVIDPFDPAQLGPNSYDFHLGDRCRVYRDQELDVAKENPTVDVEFTDAGLILEPKRLYLFNTLETMGSNRYVPIIRGRSSIGRLGIFIHITADLIDLGSINQWTLQMHSVAPVKVRPKMLIGQVTFWSISGEVSLYSGKYATRESPVASLSYLDYLESDSENG
jgi:dCTP deaminase